MTMIQNYPLGKSTSFVGKIDELEKMILPSNTPVKDIDIDIFRKKKAIKKIKTVFRQLDIDISTAVERRKRP